MKGKRGSHGLQERHPISQCKRCPNLWLAAVLHACGTQSKF